MKIAITLTCLLLCNCRLFAQFPNFPTPEPANLGIYGYPSNASNPATPPSIRSTSNTSNVHDPHELSRRNQNSRQQIDEAIAHMALQERKQKTANYLIQNGFPAINEDGTEIFHDAYKEISGMLCDSIPLNLERAVFLVENAYLGNALKYENFQQAINERVQYCRWRLKELKLNPKDGLAANMAIYSLLADTLKIKQPGTEKTITHYPLKYNLDDYDSKNDFTSHFVSTLLSTNTGQCHSMPLLYLIMAERLDTKAYLSYAPRHSFVKIRDDKGAWYNLELTCRSVLSDYHYINSSYIKSEAIRNKLYLSPLSKKETVASTLVSLGRYYLVKHGYDPFILDCMHQAEKYSPNDIDTKLMEADYETRLTLEIARLLDAPNPQRLKERSAGAYKHYERMHELYKEIDDSGYEDMPPQIYQKWLEHLAREKDKERNSPQPVVRKIIK